MKTSRKAVAMILSLAMAGSLVSMSAMATDTTITVPTNVPKYNGISIQFGDPGYPATWPENSMSLHLIEAESNDDVKVYDAWYNNSVTGNYYPDILSLYAYFDNDPDHSHMPDSVTLTTSTPAAVDFLTYDENAEETAISNDTIKFSTNLNYNNNAGHDVASDVFAVKLHGEGNVIITATNNKQVKIKFQAPRDDTAAGGTTPSKVNGYLPIGQFARPNDFGWGKIFTDNTNVPGADKTAKFTNGYTASGVSLGMLGGYVQFEFANAIGNDADNPYGIDFIVYGNAFNGNPEAGCVMVYGRNEANSQYGWYNLAGSRYYMDGSQKNVNISYIKLDAANVTLNSAFTAPGIYCSKNYVPTDSTVTAEVNAAISIATWTGIPGMNGTAPVPVGWWPDANAPENYALVDKIGENHNVSGVTWNRNGSAEVISFMGLAQVVDSDNTDDYQWGYADVRANGSNYGTLSANPYATAASAGAGGDGFDLSWAVDSNGNPVHLTDVKFVRVYSGVLHNAGVFGETSTEVCGIYVADGNGTGSAVAPEIKIDGETLNNLENAGVVATTSIISGNQNILTISGLNNYSDEFSLQVNGGENIYIDGSSTNSTDIILESGGNQVQIINQSGTAEPFITLVRLTA